MKNRVEEKLGLVENLPSLPIIVHQVQKLMENKSDMKQIAAVISKDQAIASRVVRLVNSAFYGIREHVHSIQHAIVVLGLNTVRNLVIGTAVVKTFENSHWDSAFDRNRFWLHSIGTAMGCKLLAQELALPAPEDYFLAGLVHDIGILAIDQFLHDEFVAILENTSKFRTDYLLAEKNLLECSHEDAGAFLTRKWKLPEELAQVILHHHRPVGLPKEAEASRVKIAVVHLVESKSRRTQRGNFIENFGAPYSQQAFSLLKTNEKTLDNIFEIVEKEVADVAKEWGIKAHA